MLVRGSNSISFCFYFLFTNHTGESNLHALIYMLKMAARENGEKYNKLIYDLFLVCSKENWVCTNRFYHIEKAGFGLIAVRHAAL